MPSVCVRRWGVKERMCELTNVSVSLQKEFAQNVFKKTYIPLRLNNRKSVYYFSLKKNWREFQCWYSF